MTTRVLKLIPGMLKYEYLNTKVVYIVPWNTDFLKGEAPKIYWPSHSVCQDGPIHPPQAYIQDENMESDNIKHFCVSPQ